MARRDVAIKSKGHQRNSRVLAIFDFLDLVGGFIGVHFYDSLVIQPHFKLSSWCVPYHMIKN